MFHSSYLLFPPQAALLWLMANITAANYVRVEEWVVIEFHRISIRWRARWELHNSCGAFDYFRLHISKTGKLAVYTINCHAMCVSVILLCDKYLRSYAQSIRQKARRTKPSNAHYCCSVLIKTGISRNLSKIPVHRRSQLVICRQISRYDKASKLISAQFHCEHAKNITLSPL